MIAPELASLAAAIFLFGFALFHAALAMGAPWAALAWGGQAKAGPLPPRLQMGSTILAPFIAAMGMLLPVLRADCGNGCKGHHAGWPVPWSWPIRSFEGPRTACSLPP